MNWQDFDGIANKRGDGFTDKMRALLQKERERKIAHAEQQKNVTPLPGLVDTVAGSAPNCRIEDADLTNVVQLRFGKGREGKKTA